MKPTKESYQRKSKPSRGQGCEHQETKALNRFAGEFKERSIDLWHRHQNESSQQCCGNRKEMSRNVLLHPSLPLLAGLFT